MEYDLKRTSGHDAMSHIPSQHIYDQYDTVKHRREKERPAVRTSRRIKDLTYGKVGIGATHREILRIEKEQLPLASRKQMHVIRRPCQSSHFWKGSLGENVSFLSI
jgi:hypothetical protein